MSTPAPVTHELPPLSDPQLAFLATTARCVDFEGSIRCGKSTVVLLRMYLLAYQYPGIQMLVARWKDEDVNAQLKSAWREVGAWFPPDVRPTWDGAQSAFLFPNKALVYMHSLRSNEDATRYSKVRGKTLAVVFLDQAEEIPEDIYIELKGRLSQPGMPHHIFLAPNPVDDDHWIATHFPVDGNRVGHQYLTADVYSNRAILGDAVIAGYEQDYPIGHPKRATLLEGKRGVNVIGKPVYEGYFGQDLVKPVAFDPGYALFEGWDFGHAYPAVVWAQYFPGRDVLHILGAVQGSDMFLEEFVPVVKEIRQAWYPHALVQSWCDPSGETGNQGITQTALSTLRDMDIYAVSAPKANDPAVRDKAIQTMASLMFRQRFRLNPRCLEVSRKNRGLETRESQLLVSAFSTGYVWDERKNLRANPNIRSPKKGTRYDHGMNCCEYVITGARIPSQAKPGDVQRAAQTYQSAIDTVAQRALFQEKKALQQAQKDKDPYDVPLYRSVRRTGRGSFSRRGGY